MKTHHQDDNDSPQLQQARKRWRWLRGLLLGVVIVLGPVIITGGIAGFVFYRQLVQDLPSLADLEHYQSSLVTKVYDRHGEVIADFFIEKRILVDLHDIPLTLRQATIAVEDARFLSHHGVDFWGILRAVWVNVRAGSVREGASTLTQQVARTLFLNRERTFRRKLREAILAWRIEQRFGKDDILRMYLNQIFYGHNAYGVAAASQIYFDKPVRELTLGESALIAGLPQAPNKYSPLKSLSLAVQRREHVLRRMVKGRYITNEQAQQAAKEPVHLSANYQQVNKAPYFVEFVRKYLEEQYGATALYRGGFEVHTTLDMRLQAAADRAVRRGVLAVDKRHGYQGPQRRLELTGDAGADAPLIAAVTQHVEEGTPLRVGEMVDGVVVQVMDAAVRVALKDGYGILTATEGFAWVREPKLKERFRLRKKLTAPELFQPGDVIRVQVLHVDPAGEAHRVALEQEPIVEGALLTMEVGSGHVLAMTGGYDFARSQFNRATQSLRQPGSAFKPIIYTAALEAKKTPASIIYDKAIVKEDDNENGVWKPTNYTQKRYGPTTLRTALTHSRNTVTIKLLEQIGVPAALSVAERLGITSPLAPYLSLALGSSGVTLWELTAAYGGIANGGMYVPPVFITKIVDANKQVLENNLPQARRALSPEVAYVMTSLMQGVVRYGTGRSVRALGRPVAAKTGTTNDFRDAWFLGFTPEIITGVWVGIDDRMTLGRRETGGRVASPIWLAFMREAVRGQPVTDFAIPPGVRFFRVDAKSGEQASVATESETLFEAFIDGTAPAAEAPRANDLRRTMHHWDRRRRSTAQRLDPRFFKKRSAQPDPRPQQESGLQASPTVDGAN